MKDQGKECNALADRKAHSLRRAADMIDVSVGHLRNEFRRGKLKLVKSGRRTLVTDAELRRYLEESELEIAQENACAEND